MIEGFTVFWSSWQVAIHVTGSSLCCEQFVHTHAMVLEHEYQQQQMQDEKRKRGMWQKCKEQSMMELSEITRLDLTMI